MAEKRFYNFSALIILFLLAVVQLVSADTVTFNLNRSGNLSVLDNSSAVNMPYIMLNIDQHDVIDSFRFIDPLITKTGILNFSGNVPLSIKVSGNETASEFKGTLSPGIKNRDHNGVIKVFPYEYDGSELKTYSSIVLFTHKRELDAVKTDPLYDYLIICSEKYDTCFERLKQWKTMKGLKVKLVTTEFIDTSSSGIDRQERIRNFIKDEFINNHFSYLLLGGDSTQIPVRKLYALTCGAGYYPDEDSIPADIYYSNLDGDFDFDNDQSYGELADSVDFIPDVYVGRILFDTIVYQPGPVVTRIIDYEKTVETEHLERGMFLGMVLWDPPYTPGGAGKDLIADNIIPDYYHILKFYESLGHTGDADILDSLDVGYSIINHNGHGSFKGIWVDQLSENNISRGDASSMTNGNKTGLFYSIGCWVGAFDRDTNGRNFTQCLQSAPDGGCIAIITNSRYGWGAPGYPGWGVSDVLDYQFFKLLFESENKEPGKLLAQMKTMYAPLSKQENLYRWHQYQLNYFGDPNMSLYTRYPDTLTVSMKRNGATLSVNVLKQGYPAENLLCAVSNDTVISADSTNPYGNAVLQIDPAESDYVYLCITGTNAVTFIDSFIPSGLTDTLPVITPLSVYSGAYSKLLIRNPSAESRNIHLISSIIDSAFLLTAGQDTVMTYLCSMESGIDTVYADYTSVAETLYVSVREPAFDIIDFSVCSDAFSLTLSNRDNAQMAECTLRVKLHNIDTYSDTIFTVIPDSSVIIGGSAVIPVTEDALIIDYTLSQGGMAITSGREFAGRNKLTFFDDFTAGLGNWEDIGDYWNIAGNALHCGDDTTYFANMHTTISTNEFTMFPGSICSMKIRAKLPTLEITALGPVFDLDGMFVKFATDDDTFIMDFISSGGALSESKVSLDVWKTISLELDSAKTGKIILEFVSDSIIEDSGVFIDSFIVKPAYYFASEDTSIRDTIPRLLEILRYGPSVTDRNPVYYIPGLDNEVTIRIYSLNGRILSEKEAHRNENVIADLTGFPSGVYFIRFQSGKLIYKDKIIYMR